MKSQSGAWSIALCLLAALVVAFALKARPALAPLSAHTSQQVQQDNRGSNGPSAHLWNVSLRSVVSNAALLDDEIGPAQRVSPTMQRNANPNLPTVEEFTLTPPNPDLKINKTKVSVRFPELAAEGLASAIPMTLGNQHVVLQRSADDARIFSAAIDFDWNAFAKEQQQRKDAADAGRMLPVFEGRHFVGMEKMQFVDPDATRGALQSHQPIQFDRHVLDGGVVNVFPDHELVINDPRVVEDPQRTWDPCTGVGNPANAWSFATLMMAIFNTTDLQTAETMLNNLLLKWTVAQPVNGFSVAPRSGMGQLGVSGLLGNWPADGNLPSLLNAPVRLNAVVNRIDLGALPFKNHGGELRFVFGVTSSTATPPGSGECAAAAPFFNIILEYNVPASFTTSQWAGKWDFLKLLNFDDNQPDFMNQLQTTITDQVVKATSCNGSSCLSQLRTNEVELAGSAQVWEQREFHLNAGALQEATVAQTPDGSFNFGQPACGSSGEPPCNTTNPGDVANWINQNQSVILANQGALPVITDDFPPGTSFLGGSAFNGPVVANAFWNGNGSPPINSNKARSFFSENTCNGCHGRETKTPFQQIKNRTPGNASTPSNFLLGCQGNGDCSVNQPCPLTTENSTCVELVTDPILGGTINSFGDIARRVLFLQGTIGNGPLSGGLLLPFDRPHISFVH